MSLRANQRIIDNDYNDLSSAVLSEFGVVEICPKILLETVRDLGHLGWSAQADFGFSTKISPQGSHRREAGDFSFACGFPTHSANGHRIFLKIKKDLEKAAFIKSEKKKEDAK